MCASEPIFTLLPISTLSPTYAKFQIFTFFPILLPDELRDKKQDLDFLKKNQKKLPEKIIKQASPWHL